ncbi:hypothetical protein DFH06DRAFT_62499 [Mycena polygramma]|nr:hypothetical protein DFH06DRAFT_171382 [Mycena polygramma]KAJ7620846.1 hypothetical protein DFH06DRAFT_62499 [Mycena polygramma]
MLFVPQELVDKIIGEVHDLAALKSCALAGSSFRQPSQKILLYSLTLRPGVEDTRPSYTAAHTLLTKSPHIAPYVTRLGIHLPAAFFDGAAFFQVLKQLTNVRMCILDVQRGLYPYVYLLDSYLSPFILDFLMRQPLRQLHIHHARSIPLPVLSSLLRAAPIMSFAWIDFLEYDSAQLAEAAVTQSSTMKCLNTIHNGDRICDILALPQLAFHTAALRELEIEVSYRHRHIVPGLTLISNAAQTLERLVVRFDEMWTAPVLPLPSLPALRRLAVLFTLPNFLLRWLLDTVLTFLASTSDLLHITVTFLQVSLVRAAPLPAGLERDLFAALDSALGTLPNVPVLTWRFPISAEYDSPLRDFSTLVRGGMPKMDSKACIVFERYTPPRQGEELVSGPRWGMEL